MRISNIRIRMEHIRMDCTDVHAWTTAGDGTLRPEYWCAALGNKTHANTAYGKEFLDACPVEW
jgi:hypothetical protein